MCLSVFWWSNWLPPAPNGNSILTPSKVKNSGPSFTKRWRNISHSCFLILFWKLQNTKPSSESFVSDHHYKCWNLQRLYISYMTAYKTSYIISQPCIKNKNEMQWTMKCSMYDQRLLRGLYIPIPLNKKLEMPNIHSDCGIYFQKLKEEWTHNSVYFITRWPFSHHSFSIASWVSFSTQQTNFFTNLIRLCLGALWT